MNIHYLSSTNQSMAEIDKYLVSEKLDGRLKKKEFISDRNKDLLSLSPEEQNYEFLYTFRQGVKCGNYEPLNPNYSESIQKPLQNPGIKGKLFILIEDFTGVYESVRIKFLFYKDNNKDDITVFKIEKTL